MRKLLLAGVALLALASAAHADLKVVQTTSFDSPQYQAAMEAMTPQQRANMEKSGSPLAGIGGHKTTLYFGSGHKVRADLGTVTYLVDASGHQATQLNTKTHTYRTHAYAPPRASAGQFAATVKSTGQTKMILGHRATRYTLSATSASLPGTIIQGDIWAAADLPQPPLMSSGGPYAQLQTLIKKIKGYPLISSIVITGSPLGNTTFKSVVTSISKTALPASTFAIPAGYHKAGEDADGMGQ